jgi:isopentenyldiphosphate isomerase
MTEIIDVFDANHRLLGTEERVAAHKAAQWHQTFHCWIVGVRDSRRFVLLQLRAPGKRSYPDMLDITAAGHLEAGETPMDGLRELKEELGVDPDHSNLRYLGIKHDIADEPGGIHNREFAHVFLLRDDRPLNGYRLQEDEVSGLVEIELKEGLRLFAGEVESINCPATRIVDGVASVFERPVAVTDLIPRVDPYYLKIFIQARNFLDGDPYLSI